jgi:hypothetical protein
MLGDYDHKLIEDAALSCQSGFLTHINAPWLHCCSGMRVGIG